MDPRIQRRVLLFLDLGISRHVDLSPKDESVVPALIWRSGAPKSGTGSLWCADLDMPTGEVAESRNDKVTLLEDLPESIDLDVDIETNILYMSGRGEMPFGNTISRLDLNRVQEGLETEIIVERLHEGVGIAHDRKENRIYITDLIGSLYAANEDGSDKQVLHRDVTNMLSLAVMTSSTARMLEYIRAELTVEIIFDNQLLTLHGSSVRITFLINCP
ncbi:hypothetical protein EJ05DRAFT_490679 [Pseudovirgaria hyperparasitica]|uniref:SMP-30/Gluconolactonase/LRE-like region domain-containing protein n=1 Tax=Pseudovirgaria hyperparasitica TaxID=470096 RepID=A0A6A6VU54_9PEZI|nr:uncharacterized protein EJ05DRAFT_490679 [Pseudovirgaria hyperparasitica]KAF2752777.1 hypothetical protein EJ05DRAFT_490679 [Pseudovirgaria hyperparasitica]